MAIVERDGFPGKICNRCGEWKPVMGFAIKRASMLRGGDGYLGTCKVCHNAQQRAEKRMTPEELRAKRTKPPTITECDGVSGKTCTRCNVWKPLIGFSPRLEHGKPTGDGFQNICKACRSATELEKYHLYPDYKRATNRARYIANRAERLIRMREYHAKYRDRLVAKNREYWAANKEYKNEARRLDRASNPEKYREIDRRYSLRYRDKINEYGRMYRRKNPEKIRWYNRRYREQNPQKTAEMENRRRARKMNAPGSHTITEWEALKLRYDYTCLCCGRSEPEIKLTRDHIVPLVKHGSDYIDNIQPLCRSCNSSKNVKIVDYRPNWSDSEE
ncbi:MAG TPA: HNH endonuclease signature motif containing protein [Herpetosiphonaceae bacterium]